MAQKRHTIHSVALHLDVPTVSRKLTQPDDKFRQILIFQPPIMEEFG